MANRSIVLTLLLMAAIAHSQTLEDYLNRGAEHYVHGRKRQATNQIKLGLMKYPNDPKLTALAGLIRPDSEQPPSQQSNQKNQSQGKEQSQSSQKQKQDQPQPKPDSQEPQDQQQPQPKPGEKPDEKKPAGGQPDPKQNKDAGKEPKPLPEPPPGQMTPDQAQQLLEAAQSDERPMIFVPPPERRASSHPKRDW